MSGPARRSPFREGALVFAGLAAYLLVVFWEVLVTRRYTGFLDNHVHYVSYHLFFSHLLDGALPLWTPHHNGGMALWPLTDIHRMLDPLPWIVYPLAKAAGVSGFQAFQVLVWLWLAVFGTGLYAVCRSLGRGVSASFFAALVGAGSYMATLSFMQANGLLLHAYPAPWVVWLLLRCLRAPSRAGAFALGAVGALWLSTYSLPLDLLAAAAFAGTAATVRPRETLGALRTAAPQAGWILLGALPFAAGLAVTGLRARELLPLARLAEPATNSGYWDLSFLGSVLAELPGTGFTGTIGEGDPSRRYLLFALIKHEALLFPGACAYAALAFALAARRGAPGGRGLRAWSPSVSIPAAYLLVVGVLFSGLAAWTALKFGERGVLFGYRNWRFLYPYLIGAIAVLCAEAIDRLQRLPPGSGWIPGAFRAALALVAVPYAGWMIGPELWRVIGRGHVDLTGPLLRLGIPALLVLAAFAASRGRRPFPFGVAMAALLAGELALHNRRWIPASLPETPGWLLAREPSIGLKGEPFPEARIEAFPIRDRAPFHKEGAAVWGTPVLGMDPEANAPGSQHGPNMAAIGFYYPAASHWFREPHYHAVMTGEISPDLRRAWGGVDAPVLRLLDRVSVFRADLRFDGAGSFALGNVPDPAGAVFLEEASAAREAARLEGPQQGDGEPGAVRLLAASRSSVAVEVDARRPALLYVADGFDPAWRASVDGEEAPVYRANLAFKAVPVPAGVHRVELAYRPWGYVVTFGWRLAWMAALVALAARAVLRSRAGREGA